MGPKETIANFTLGVGMIANPTLAHVDYRPIDVSQAIHCDFITAGKYLSHGLKATQVEIEDAQKREAAQLKFESILASAS